MIFPLNSSVLAHHNFMKLPIQDKKGVFFLDFPFIFEVIFIYPESKLGYQYLFYLILRKTVLFYICNEPGGFQNFHK